MNIVAKIKNASLYPPAYSIVSAQSLAARMKALGKKPTVHFEQPYQGQKIMLLALYEKGQLRSDIENLLITAKSLGMYVLAVNTLKVPNPDRLKDKIDCYIERPNFGRDFGSYQTGFLHIYKKGWEQQCERLLMLNDSLFYSKANLAAFLEQMITTDIEALGATENHDFEYHLGSFSISFHKNILNHKIFKKYWFNYKKSDVRPRVIKNGELRLSRTLKRCITSSEQMKAIFDTTWMSEQLQSDARVLENVFYLNRDSDIFPWKKPSIHELASSLESKHVIEYRKDSYSLKNNHHVDSFVVTNALDYLAALKKISLVNDEEAVLRLIQEELKSLVINSFSSGSQIHNFGLLLHFFGLPIIKADAVYRGVFAASDVEKIVRLLHADEIAHFRSLMYSRPYGGNQYFGWKRSAFVNGLI
jgi:hypothetical protein